MLGCSSWAAWSDSRTKDARRSGSPARSPPISLRATVRPSLPSRARYTTPMPPRPARASVSYPPTIVPGGSSWAVHGASPRVSTVSPPPTPSADRPPIRATPDARLGTLIFQPRLFPIVPPRGHPTTPGGEVSDPPAWTGDPRDRMRIREAERAGKPFLVMRDQAGEQRLLTLPADATTFVVGRSVDSDVPIPWDDRVSRTHAQMVRVGTRWYVEDDGLSRNGTWVNEERVTSRRLLRDGDVLRAGHTAVLVRIPAQGSS